MSAHREHVGDAKLANNADACFDLKLLFACWGVQVAILREASRRAASATVAAMPRAIVLLLVSFAAAEGSSVSSSTLKACTSEQEDDAPHEHGRAEELHVPDLEGVHPAYAGGNPQ